MKRFRESAAASPRCDGEAMERFVRRPVKRFRRGPGRPGLAFRRRRWPCGRALRPARAASGAARDLAPRLLFPLSGLPHEDVRQFIGSRDQLRQTHRAGVDRDFAAQDTGRRGQRDGHEGEATWRRSVE